MGKRIEYIPGERIGITRLCYIQDENRDKPKIRQATLLCDCGTEINIPIAWVVHGNTTSCGCLKSEMLALKNRTHGQATRSSHSGAYRSWKAMHQRCEVSENYANVTVCGRWNAFENFYADMGDRPEGMSIERVNNYGNYEPGNCVWADRSVQANNTRNTVKVTIDGETHTISQWCRIKGISYSLVKQRRQVGMSLEEAICKPLNKSKSHKKGGGCE